MSHSSLFSSLITIFGVFVRPDVLSSCLGDGSSSSSLLQTVFVSVCLFRSPTCERIRQHVHAGAPPCYRGLRNTTQEKTKNKNPPKTHHLFVCPCGSSPAWSRAAFSQVCCDLTGPLTAATVNIRLSCDSRCGPQEAQKGQRLLLPLPTSKLSDFIPALVRPSHFERTRHRRCCITSPRAAASRRQTRIPMVRACAHASTPTCSTGRHATHAARGRILLHVLSDSDSGAAAIGRHVLFASAVQRVNRQEVAASLCRVR